MEVRIGTPLFLLKSGNAYIVALFNIQSVAGVGSIQNIFKFVAEPELNRLFQSTMDLSTIAKLRRLVG